MKTKLQRVFLEMEQVWDWTTNVEAFVELVYPTTEPVSFREDGGIEGARERKTESEG